MGIEPDEKTMQEFMSDIDKDNDSKVSLHEYITALCGKDWTVEGASVIEPQVNTDAHKEAQNIASMMDKRWIDEEKAATEDAEPEQGVSVEVTVEPNEAEADENAAAAEETTAAMEDPGAEDDPVKEPRAEGEASEETAAEVEAPAEEEAAVPMSIEEEAAVAEGGE